MNKTELITSAAEKSGLTKKDTEKAVNAIIESITKSVAAGESVQIIGFGTFERREREARTGINPKTKESIVIPASKVPAFKAGKQFKEEVNG